MCCHMSSVAMLGEVKGCVWGATVERALAERAAEERKTAAHASGDKLVMPKP
jgi:hypothetical protein